MGSNRQTRKLKSVRKKKRRVPLFSHLERRADKSWNSFVLLGESRKNGESVSRYTMKTFSFCPNLFPSVVLEDENGNSFPPFTNLRKSARPCQRSNQNLNVVIHPPNSVSFFPIPFLSISHFSKMWINEPHINTKLCIISSKKTFGIWDSKRVRSREGSIICIAHAHVNPPTLVTSTPSSVS